MMLAPFPAMSATLASAPSGAAGVFHTLGMMRRCVNASKTDLGLIQTATGIVWLTPAKDELSEITALFDFVRDHVRYVRDPHGVESLCDPRMTLQRMVGDCDDQTALLCALFEAVGYPSRFVMAAYNTPGIYEHVYCQVFACGEWIDCDPTEPMAIGYAPPGAISTYIEG